MTPGHTSLYTAYVTTLRCAIPEFKFDLDKMIDLVMTDKRNNPSNYALVVMSEGAEWAATNPGIWRARRVRSPQKGQRRRRFQR